MTVDPDLGWAKAGAHPDEAGSSRCLELLRELVDIDTPSQDRESLAAGFDVLQREFEQRGLSVRFVPGDDDVPVLVAENSNGGDAPSVGFLGHVDTVFGPEETRARPFTIDDGLARGPGVADMKGGLVSMLYAMDLLQSHARVPPLRIVVNGDEEVGSATSRQVLREELADRDVILVFEPGRPGGDFVTHRRGTIRARLTIEGVAAHSGVAPRSGANAIHELAARISAIAGLASDYPDCDINVTLVEGGSRINIVPDQASCDLDARTSTVEDGEGLRRDLERIAARPGPSGTSGSLHWHASRPPLEATSRQAPLLDAFDTAAGALGVGFQAVGTGGGSDANLLGGIDAAILDGCGPVGDNYHRSDEYVETRTITERGALVAAALTVFAQQRHADA